MKVTLTHGEKSVELDLTAEQLASLGLKEEKKRTGYERAYQHSTYYTLDSIGKRINLREEYLPIDENIYDSANYYSDKTIAENNIRADRLMRKLRRYAAEHGGICNKEDWEGFEDKFYIGFGYLCDGIDVHRIKKARDFANIYFRDEQACKDAIKEFRNELTWYFTEYQAMLY